MGNKSMCGAPLWQSISLVQLIVGKTWFPLKKFDTDTDRSTVLNIRSPVGKIGKKNSSKGAFLQFSTQNTVRCCQKIHSYRLLFRRHWGYGDTMVTRFSVVLDWLYQK